jgi:hypothetical protein
MKEVTVEGKMLMHIAFETVHQIKYEYTIKGEGFLNDRIFYGEISTPKRKNSFGKFGKPSKIYYFNDTPKGKEFKDIPSLLASKDLILK